jgi:type II secretory pathway predicted ATPase ExeA
VETFLEVKMHKEYRAFWGFKKKPFASNIKITDILKTDEVQNVKARFDYTISLGGIGVVTGDVGSGKSTALRYASANLHKSEYSIFYITASSGSIIELYRQIAEAFGIVNIKGSRAGMISMIRNEITELVSGCKRKVLLIIDEASLLRMEVFSELHTIVQFRQDSEMWLPMILAGQPTLIDKLQYRTSSPLASRIIARSHLDGLNLQGMKEYLNHHIRLAGIDIDIFTDQAITAIHQGSGGLLRKANHLARGALVAAVAKKEMNVSAEHVRLAATEVF